MNIFTITRSTPDNMSPDSLITIADAFLTKEQTFTDLQADKYRDR